MITHHHLYLFVRYPGYYQGPPVMAPPQYTAPPPPRSQPGFLERCLAIFCCCDPSMWCCCCDPSILWLVLGS
ncbi:hypothetical protein ACSBR2_018964 [Camellia fascicularis]